MGALDEGTRSLLVVLCDQNDSGSHQSFAFFQWKCEWGRGRRQEVWAGVEQKVCGAISRVIDMEWIQNDRISQGPATHPGFEFRALVTKQGERF